MDFQIAFVVKYTAKRTDFIVIGTDTSKTSYQGFSLFETVIFHRGRLKTFSKLIITFGHNITTRINKHAIVWRTLLVTTHMMLYLFWYFPLLIKAKLWQMTSIALEKHLPTNSTQDNQSNVLLRHDKQCVTSHIHCSYWLFVLSSQWPLKYSSSCCHSVNDDRLVHLYIHGLTVRSNSCWKLFWSDQYDPTSRSNE